MGLSSVRSSGCPYGRCRLVEAMNVWAADVVTAAVVAVVIAAVAVAAAVVTAAVVAAAVVAVVVAAAVAVVVAVLTTVVAVFGVAISSLSVPFPSLMALANKVSSNTTNVVIVDRTGRFVMASVSGCVSRSPVKKKQKPENPPKVHRENLSERNSNCLALAFSANSSPLISL